MKELEEEIKRLRFELMVTIPDELQTALHSGAEEGSTEISDILTRQDFTNIRLLQLTHRVESCKKINKKNIPLDKVNIGSLVTVRNINEDMEISYLITYPEFMKDNIISPTFDYVEVTVNSPIGKALMNRSVGDEVIAQLPSKNILYNILKLYPLYAFEKALDFY